MQDFRAISIVLGSLCVLAACGQDDSKAMARVERDPLLVQALNDQLMVDPDLAMLNEGNAALTISFDRSLPPIDASPDTVALTRDQMRMQLLEGGSIPDLPQPGKASGDNSIIAATCGPSESLDRSAIWAARLPSYAAIPPRGAVAKAEGGDLPRCRIRQVFYLTPLELKEVTQFHFTLASRAGMNPKLSTRSGGSLIITAQREGAQLAIEAQQSPDGLLSVKIVSVEPSA